MKTIEELSRAVEELAAKVDRLEAARACSNLVGRWLFYLPSCRFEELCSLWAQHTAGTELEIHGFIYEGIKGVRQYFINENISHDDMEARKGLMNVQTYTTEVMEVAADGNSARATYISPGIETDVYHDRPGFEELVKDLDLYDGKATGRWAWKKFAFEFIKEDGQWKIWKYRQYALIKTPYERSWTTKLAFPSGAYMQNKADRISEDSRWFYAPDTLYPDYDPDPPVSYTSYDNIGDVKPFIG